MNLNCGHFVSASLVVLITEVWIFISPALRSRWMMKINPIQGLYSQRRCRLTGIGIPIINIRRSDDRLRFIMRIIILIIVNRGRETIVPSCSELAKWAPNMDDMTLATYHKYLHHCINSTPKLFSWNMFGFFRGSVLACFFPYIGKLNGWWWQNFLVGQTIIVYFQTFKPCYRIKTDS